jgi:hypothetical protein
VLWDPISAKFGDVTGQYNALEHNARMIVDVICFALHHGRSCIPVKSIPVVAFSITSLECDAWPKFVAL